MIGTIAIVLSTFVVYVLMVVICERIEARRERQEPSVTDQDRARARVLLHATARERQLAQLGAEMEHQAQSQLWRWEHEDWGGGR